MEKIDLKYADEEKMLQKLTSILNSVLKEREYRQLELNSQASNTGEMLTNEVWKQAELGLLLEENTTQLVELRSKERKDIIEGKEHAKYQKKINRLRLRSKNIQEELEIYREGNAGRKKINELKENLNALGEKEIEIIETIVHVRKLVTQNKRYLILSGIGIFLGLFLLCYYAEKSINMLTGNQGLFISLMVAIIVTYVIEKRILESWLNKRKRRQIEKTLQVLSSLLNEIEQDSRKLKQC